MKYMLDTNTCIAIMKRAPAQVRAKLKTLALEEVGVSSIVIAELWYGITKSQRPVDNEEALNDFVRYVTVMDWPVRAAPAYGEIRTYLKTRGTPIGAMDLLVAAHAFTEDAVLVTDNVKEFTRVPKLKVENWLVHFASHHEHL